YSADSPGKRICVASPSFAFEPSGSVHGASVAGLDGQDKYDGSFSRVSTAGAVVAVASAALPLVLPSLRCWAASWLAPLSPHRSRTYRRRRPPARNKTGR